MEPDVLDSMMRQIVPFRMTIAAVEGTWKLSQNKPDNARFQAADRVEAFGVGSETTILAALMRGADGQA
jgi:transcriptional regulator